MSEVGCTYPIIALAHRGRDEDVIFLEVYFDEGDFSRWLPSDMANPLMVASEIFDSAGRRWEIAGFERHKPVIRWWDMSTWFGRGAWDVKVELRAAAPMSLEAAKARMIEVVDSDPTMWCDEELVVGAAGEPIDEEVLIARVHDRIKAVRSFAELPGVMDNAYYTFEDAEADGLLKPRAR